MENAATTVPPFIPGLLIVCLLITISILIGWRNYIRRGNTRAIPGLDEWAFWEGDAMQGASRRPAKPKLWEVGVSGRGVDEKAFDEPGWEKIMPLSATSLTSEPPVAETPQISQAARTQTPSYTPSLLDRSKFLSSTAAAPPPGSEPTPPAPLHRLQVSVLILMPSLPARARSRLRDASAPSPSLPDPGLGSTASETDAEGDAEEDVGAPEVAFGVAVLPWRKAEGEVGQTDISVM